MFTSQDYKNYFTELEDIYKKTINAYTDLLNELGNYSIESKLSSMATENMDAFRFMREQKEKF